MANYCAMQLLERTHGSSHLSGYLRQMLWRTYEQPRTRVAPPLLRADNAFLGYRKGAHALYGLSRYIGAQRMNGALRRLFQSKSTGTGPLPTTLDLYRELQAATPESLQGLLHDYFEANTYWDLATERATAKATEAGSWQVALDVRVRKFVVDDAGVETELPMNDEVEVGVFARDDKGRVSGEPFFVERQHLRPGRQTVTVTVPREPARAGIDPYNLLIDWNADDNVVPVKGDR
jgi:hypothetical protein